MTSQHTSKSKKWPDQEDQQELVKKKQLRPANSLSSFFFSGVVWTGFLLVFVHIIRHQHLSEKQKLHASI